MSSISVTSFRSVPTFARGLVRDLRVRWAVREAGLDYDVEKIGFDERRSPDYLRRHPFGQVPVARFGDTSLFESGAILYAFGLRHPALLPEDENGRLETLSWMFAALNTIEPPILTIFSLDRLNPDADRDPAFRATVIVSIEDRLSQLSEIVKDRDYLTGRFSIADIIMTTSLRFLQHTDLISRSPHVSGYLARCEARPAFQDALAEQQASHDEGAALAA